MEHKPRKFRVELALAVVLILFLAVGILLENTALAQSNFIAETSQSTNYIGSLVMLLIFVVLITMFLVERFREGFFRKEIQEIHNSFIEEEQKNSKKLIENFKGSLESLKINVDEDLSNAFLRQERRLDARLTEQTETFNGRLFEWEQGFHYTITKMETDLANQDKKLENSLAQQNTRIDNRFAEQEKKIASIVTFRTEAHEKSIDSRLANFEDRLNGRLSELRGLFTNELSNQRENLMSQINGVGEQVNNRLSEWVSMLESRFSKHEVETETRMRSVEGRLNGVMEDHTYYSEAMSGILNRKFENPVGFMMNALQENVDDRGKIVNALEAREASDFLNDACAAREGENDLVAVLCGTTAMMLASEISDMEIILGSLDLLEPYRAWELLEDLDWETKNTLMDAFHETLVNLQQERPEGWNAVALRINALAEWSEVLPINITCDEGGYQEMGGYRAVS